MKILPVKYSGQTLVEIVVTVGVVILLATALLSATIRTVNISRQARNKSISTKLVEESFEIIRSQRDNGWNAFKSTYDTAPNKFCINAADNIYKITAANPCTPVVENNQNFTRTATFNYVSSGIPRMVVDVEVKWMEGATEKKSFASSYFTDWK